MVENSNTGALSKRQRRSFLLGIGYELYIYFLEVTENLASSAGDQAWLLQLSVSIATNNS